MLLDIWNPREASEMIPASTRAVATMKHRARRFRFTDEVTTAIAHLMRDFPNALLDHYQFALPPYPTTYIEYDIDVFLKQLGAPSTHDLPRYFGKVKDKTIGYLIHESQINVLVQGDDFGPPSVTTICYTMQDHHAPRGFVPMPMNEDMHLIFMLGSTFNNGRASLTPERAHDLCRRYRVLLDAEVYRNIQPKRLAEVLQGACGELRNLLALLLWINQPKVFLADYVGGQRGWYRSKPVAYAAHHVVKMRKEVGRRMIVRAFAPRRAPRRHEVEAFWRNYQKTPGCIHDWPLFPDEHGHWHCTKCPQWRTRVKQHERGDAGIGFVTKEYTT